MPQVPSYNKQVQGAQLPNIRVNSQVDLGSRQTQALGEEVLRVISTAKKNADDVALLNADKQMADFENNFMYGENGAIQKSGNDAFGLKINLDDEFKKKYDDIYGSLSGNDQKMAFERRAQIRKQSLDTSVMRHVSHEIDKFQDQSTKDFIAVEQEAAYKNIHNPERVAMSFDLQKQEILKFADRKGLSPESTKMILDDTVGRTHSGIIAKLIQNGQDIEAENYYRNVRDEIPEKYNEQIAKDLEVGITKGFAQRFADNLMSRGVSETEAYKATESIDDPKKREAAENRLAKQFAMKERAKRDYQDNMFQQAVKKFDATGVEDPILIARLDAQGRSAFDSYRDRNPLRDDTASYYKLYNMALNPESREKFVNYNLLYEKGNLNNQHFNDLMKMQQDIKSGKADSIKNLNGAYSDAEILKSIYESAGFKTKNTEEFSKYKIKADEAVEKYKEQTGKKYLTNEELQKIGSQLTTQAIVDRGWIWDTRKPKFLIDVDTIPKKDVELIKQSLSKNGKPLTDKNIVDLYLMKQGQK